jgi:sec-independent protein translocase protein TatA
MNENSVEEPPMFGLGGQELILILLIILLLFGSKKLPELARGLGKGIKEFKKSQNEIEDEFKSAAEETPKKEKSPSSTQS